MTIGKNLTLLGSGRNRTVLDGQDSVVKIPVLRVAAGVTVQVQALTITGGNNFTTGGTGGGIVNQGALTLSDVGVIGNVAASSGGGIANFGGGSVLVVNDSAVTGNAAAIVGGGLFSQGTVTLNRTNLTANRADVGAGVFVSSGTTTIAAGSAVTGNIAGFEGGGIYTDDEGATTIAAGGTVRNNTPNNCAGPGPFDGSCPAP